MQLHMPGSTLGSTFMTMKLKRKTYSTFSQFYVQIFMQNRLKRETNFLPHTFRIAITFVQTRQIFISTTTQLIMPILLLRSKTVKLLSKSLNIMDGQLMHHIQKTSSVLKRQILLTIQLSIA